MEKKRNNRRRSSSASTTTPDEEVNLLDGDGDSVLPGDAQYTSSRVDRSRWIRPLSLAFTFLLLVAIGFSSLTTLFLASPFNGAAHESRRDQMLGIELHPDNHVFRAPKTITHHWAITSGFRFPDGVKKEVYLVNDEFPGPTIECRSGDRLVVHVTNALKSGEGISIHWHGLHMRGRNGMDGAVGITQCPIPAGEKFTYDFDIDEEQAGTFWWHAHSQVQRGDGMYGGLVVHRPAQAQNDMERYGYKKDVLVLIGDWYHRSAEDVLAWFTSARGFGNEPVPDSLLVNGVGRFICSMAVPARPVECVDKVDEGGLAIFRKGLKGHSLRIRVVNVGSLAGFTLATDSISLTPITVDGGFPIFAPAVSSVGILHPGERMDVILNLKSFDQTDPRRLHIVLDPENLKYQNSALRQNQSFPLFMEAAPMLSDTSMLNEQPPSGTHYDLQTAVASTDNSAAANTSDQTVLLYARTEKLAIFSNHPKGFINRTSWSPQSQPLISLPRSAWNNDQLVPYIPIKKSSAWVDVIINNLDDGSHPFHLHGHDFFVIASSRSEINWGSYSPFKDGPKPEFNLKNPPRKDTVRVPRRGYVVIRVETDNPGLWMLHCHVIFHQGSGMAMALQIGGVEEHESVDVNAAQLCHQEKINTIHDMHAM